MNILVPNSWLSEHLKTKATPKEITNYLSLCSQSVEKINSVGEDEVYEIEITTNRPDCLAVYGIARELTAILPRFGIPAKLKPLQHTTYNIQHTTKGLPLEVKITNPSFCPRFTALIFDNIKMGPSPKVVQERLEKSSIRALDNVVDISNYLMLELGQPIHTFDYDKILGAKMILREAKEGEKVITLDSQTRDLPPGTIIIEDGKGRIIDLCGIMGAENSAVDMNTKRVLLFIQTYDPARIRRTCQQMAFRTEAASRFEKGIDPESVMIAMNKAVTMFEKNCGAKIASNLIDIYPNPPKQKTIKLDLSLVEKLIGIPIPKKEVIKILASLGFLPITNHQSPITFTIPHWRNGDISIPEDLIEEVARIYGYHNLPVNLPDGQIPEVRSDEFFQWGQRVKNALKFWGFIENYNYSMISKQTLEKVHIDPQTCLKIANPLSEEWLYMRPTLFPSLLEVVAKNQDEFEKIKIFELANIYLSQGKQQLPQEKPRLAAVLTKSDFYLTKGILEVILEELGIEDYQIATPEAGSDLFYQSHAAQIKKGKEILGIFGEISPGISAGFGIKGKVFAFNLDFETLTRLATTIKKFQPLPKYPAIIEDLSFVVPGKIQIGEIIQSIKLINSFIKSVEFLNAYEDTRTFRVIYQHPEKTLTDFEVKKIREIIIKRVESKFGAKLKEKD